MKKNNFNIYFSFDWVLHNELAIGPAPINEDHIDKLKKKGIIAILSLCSERESRPPENIENHFQCRRIVLPDHKYERKTTLEEVNNALSILEELIDLGPVFIHCVAAIERSPMICMAWLIKKHKLSFQQSIDYLMEVHPGSNPLSSQLKILRILNKK